MSRAATATDQEAAVADAVDLLVERYGHDGAENRLLLALSLVRQRRHAGRQGDSNG